MMKKILFSLLIACLYTQLAYASGVIIEDLPEKPWVVDLTRGGAPEHIRESVLDDLLLVLREEKKGRPLDQNWHKVLGFTLEEGRKYLKGVLEIAFTDNKEFLNFLPGIFSEKHFIVPSPVAFIDLLEASEDKQYALYCEDRLIDVAIGNCFSAFNINDLELEKNRIDPRLFMMGSQIIMNFYFQKRKEVGGPSFSFEEYNENKKEGYQRGNKDLNRSYEQFRAQVFGYFDFPQSLEERRQFYLTHDLSLLTQEMIRNIFNTASRILSYTALDDNIVIFGNTPYYVGRALKLLMGEVDPAKKRNIIEFPFSGTPNSIRGQSFGFKSEDIVTLERLDHLKSRLKGFGLMNGQELLQHKTYFVDVIGGGGGVAYTLATILQELKSQNLPQMPHFEIISLNLFNKTHVKHRQITSTDGEDGDKIQLSLPSNASRYFKIDCQIIHLPGHSILDSMPDDTPVLRVFPRYNAAYWSEEYDYLLTQEYPPHIKIMFEHFDTNIRQLMTQSHLQSLERQADVEMTDVEKS